MTSRDFISTRSRRGPSLGRSGLFLLILGGLFTAQLTPLGQQAAVVPFTDAIASLSAWVVQLFDSEVVAQGKVLFDRSSRFGVSIEAGCNGVEATIVLIAAMLAFPASWGSRLLGIAVGFLTVQTLNLLRIISLFYLGQWNRTAFEWAHLYVWQGLIMLDVLLVYLVWLRLERRRRSAATSDLGI